MRAYRGAAILICAAAVLLLTSGSDTTSPLQQGINVLWYYNGSDTPAQITTKARETLHYAQELGANTIAINFPFYMTSANANSVHAGSGTPSVKQLRLVVQVAKRYGLAIMLRPLLDEATFGTSAWRGTLEPTDRDAWFVSYSQFLRPYLEMAGSTGVQMFSIGVEFTSLETDDHWYMLEAQARQIYQGQLVYANNWFGVKTNAAGLAAGLQGLDAYFPVHLGDDATVSDIVDTWNHWLDSVHSSVNVNSMLLSEVGIPAQSGAYAAPYSLGNANHRIEPAIQQRWFTAACQIMHERHMPGIYYWNITFGSVPGTFESRDAPPTSIVGRGSIAIRICFGS